MKTTKIQIKACCMRLRFKSEIVKKKFNASLDNSLPIPITTNTTYNEALVLLYGRKCYLVDTKTKTKKLVNK